MRLSHNHGWPSSKFFALFLPACWTGSCAYNRLPFAGGDFDLLLTFVSKLTPRDIVNKRHNH
jgi:hypothetical protein